MGSTMAGLALCFSLFASLVHSWTITEYFKESVVTIPEVSTGTRTRSAETTTVLILVMPTGEDPAAVTTISTVFPSHTAIGYDKIVLEPGEYRPMTLDLGLDDDNPNPPTYRSYYVPFTFTKPSGCTSSDAVATPTVTETAILDLPDGIEGAITPISSSTETFGHTFGTISRTTYIVSYEVDPTRVPEAILDRARDGAYPFMYQYCDERTYHGDGNFSMCRPFYFGGNDYGYGIGGGYECANGKFWTWGLRPWSLAVIVLMSWIVFFILVSLLQAFLRFRSLMRGMPAKRGIPSLCSLIVPVLCLPALFFNRRGFSGQSLHRRTQLREQWAAMSLKTKLSLFFRHGFTTDYPPILGTPPPTATSTRQAQTRSQRARWPTPSPEDEYELSPPPPPYSRSDSPPKYVNEEEEEAAQR